AFLETYRPFEVDGMPFMDWVDRHLDPTAITNSFQSKTWANRLVDSILRRE
ncbi:MAG: protein tyrosine phosphatase, partial [Candidatus Puniceispirillum sp. TMED52]